MKAVSRSDCLVPAIVINEFMAKNEIAYTDNFGEYADYIELLNNNAYPFYLGDKFLSDEFDNPSKWKMPDVQIAANRYLIIWADDEEEQNQYHSNFKLNAEGDEIGLYASAIEYFSLIDSVSFQNQLADISTGRLPNGTGPFIQLSQPSPAAQTISLLRTQALLHQLIYQIIQQRVRLF